MDKVYGFKVKSGGPCPVLDPWELIVNRHTLPGTTISHHRVVICSYEDKFPFPMLGYVS